MSSKPKSVAPDKKPGTKPIVSPPVAVEEKPNKIAVCAPPPEVCVTDSSPRSPLIVVSNRLPFVLKRNTDTNELERKASAGGLVTAVCPVVIKGNGIWVGWSGIYDVKKDEVIPESDPNDHSPTAGLRSDQVCIKGVNYELIRDKVRKSGN